MSDERYPSEDTNIDRIRDLVQANINALEKYRRDSTVTLSLAANEYQRDASLNLIRITDINLDSWRVLQSLL